MTTNRMSTIRRSLSTAAVGAALIVGMAGCAPASDYEPLAAERIQSRVLDATGAAASGDHAGVLRTLDTLDVELRDELARGHITQERFDAVTAAIALVRAEVEAAIAASQPAPAPAPAPEPDRDGDDDDDDNNDDKKSDKKDDKAKKDDEKGKGNKGNKGKGQD